VAGSPPGEPPGHEFRLKLILVALLLPEGTSFFIGDFRLTAARVLLIVFSIAAVIDYRRRPVRTFLMSDLWALTASLSMLIAGAVTEGFTGLKGAGIGAVEFAGCYYVFRYSLAPMNSSVRVVRFACKAVIIVVAIALLDPLTGKLATYEFTKALTGYTKPAVEAEFAVHAESLFRDGLVRAAGPLEHSILFGCVCVWFGTLAFFTFPRRLFGWAVAIIAGVGLWFSQARGAWVAYLMAFTLAGYYIATKSLRWRWRLIGTAMGLFLAVVFIGSGAPVATLMRIGGLSPSAAYYRQVIWATAGPMLMNSPFVGIGSSWDWLSNSDLFGPSVDAFWLQNSMNYGIPASLFVFLTMITPFWRHPLDNVTSLSAEEQRLSVALGIVTTTCLFMGFIVHFWGVCWILLGAFAGARASLVEAATLRSQAALNPTATMPAPAVGRKVYRFGARGLKPQRVWR
jgi:hypothetical protein